MMRIALVSFNPLWEDKLGNIHRVESLLQKVVSLGADYVVFPEMTLTGFSMNSVDLGEPLENSETLKHFQYVASSLGLNIIFGMITKQDGNYYNTCMAINKIGQIEAYYDKVHPFSFSGEDQYYAAGHRLSSVGWPGGWGLTVCYDLRFPELYQALSFHNMILINIASWPEKRIHHWHSLLVARAIENQSFMIGVNRTGSDGNGLSYIKSSTIISPEGQILSPVKTDKEIDIYEINVENAEQFRKDFPVKKDRKTEFYKDII